MSLMGGRFMDEIYADFKAHRLSFTYAVRELRRTFNLTAEGAREILSNDKSPGQRISEGSK